MPESKLPTNSHRESDALSTQEPGSHIVEVQISGGESDDTESSAQESPQPLVADIGPAEYTADIDRNTIATDEFVNDGEDDASEMIDLAISLMAECKAGLSLSNLNNAVILFRQVIDSRPRAHPLHTDAMRDLASALGIRFMYTNQIHDLTESLTLRGEIIKGHNLDQNSSHNADTATPLTDETDTEDILELAKGMLTDFQKSTSLHVLNNIVFLVQKSLPLLSSAPTSRFVALTTLADGFYARFNHSNDTTDLNEAISGMQDALKCCDMERDQQLLNTNSRICGLLAARFDLMGDICDLQMALDVVKNGNIKGTETSMGILQSLKFADELYERFTKSGNMADLNIAVALFREGIAKLPQGGKNYAGVINSLASALWVRFERGGQRNDLDEAISLHRRALELRLPPNSDRSKSFHNLGTTLQTRFEQGGQRNDLAEAISLHRQALELRLPPHPLRSASLNNLANALQTRFEQGGQQIDLDEAMSLFFAATQYPFQSPSNRLRIAKMWTSWADRIQHNSAMDAYEASLQALPQVAALSLNIESRQQALTVDSDGLARDASRWAIRSGHLDKAVEFLEARRSVFWSQVLSLRSPFDQLHKVAPELADKLRNIATELEIGSHRDVSAEILENLKKLSIDQEASRLNRLNEEWAQCIYEVRKLSGLEDFFSSLKAAASEHPVVILIANDDESHCLIMTSTTIHHIPLPNLHTPTLKELVDLIRIAVSQLPISRLLTDQTRDTITRLLAEDRGMRVESGIGSSDDIFKLVLRKLWNELVKPVIDFLNIKKLDKMPVLQWCPTGYFTFLPIHAAGCYNDELAIECTFDYLISSYTPTIGNLLARNSASSAAQTFQMLAVIQSKELPSTTRELAKIRQYVSSDALVELGVPGIPATVEAVAAHLSDVSVVHFACHGKQDLLQPLDSGLKLEDGLLRISRIMKEKMPNGSLAFLCACETAMGDQKLPDEAMSLGASLIFSGFRRVVATMWEMKDEDGPTVADAFYEELFRGPDGKRALEPDMAKSALALHLAVKKLLSQRISFRRWVPFIHMGK